MTTFSAVGTLVLPLFSATAILVWWQCRAKPHKPSEFDIAALSSGIWGTLLPAGLLLWGTIGLILSTARDDWRQQWKSDLRPRSLVCAVIFSSLLLASGLPTHEPIGAESWGEPLFVENPDAPIWPASQQHMWTINSPELAVVTVTSTRLPGAFSPLGTSTVTAELVQLLNTDDNRMQQSIQRMSEMTVLRSLFNPDDFELVQIPSEGHHRYFSSALDIDKDLVAVRQYVTYDALIPDSEVLQVLSIYDAKWGGEVVILTIVRPLTSVGDAWAEDIVLEWISSQPE